MVQHDFFLQQQVIFVIFFKAVNQAFENWTSIFSDYFCEGVRLWLFIEWLQISTKIEACEGVND